MSADWKATRAHLEALAEAGDLAGAGVALRDALRAEPSPRVFALGRKLAAADAASLAPIELRVLRSYTVEPMLAPLAAWGFAHGVGVAATVGDFGVFEAELLADAPAPATAVLLAARLEDLAPDLAGGFASMSDADVDARVAEVSARVGGWLEAARRQHPSALIVVTGFAPPARLAYGLADALVGRGQRQVIGELDRAIAARVAATSDCHWIDTAAVLADVGHQRAADARMNAHARQPLSPAGLSAMAAAIARVLSARFTPRRKCVVLDCDNTLWGGIVGEDGLDGIALGDEHPGSAFVAFQRALLDLNRRGILLALASKNNEADVLEVLERHPHQVLRTEHIAAHSISWGDKASALRALAETLQIGLDSLVFIDDSEYECALVRERVPEVEVHTAPADPLALVEMLGDITSLDALRISATDRQRGAMYKAQAARHDAQKASASLDEFLHSLELELEVREPTADERPLVERAAQLTQRTNQLNATTRRYVAADIDRFIGESTTRVLLVRVADRFGDYGQCGLAIVVGEGDHARIDTFLLSCRVLGRGVEKALAAAIETRARADGNATLRAEFIPSAKNGQVADLFERLGFAVLADDGGHKRYEKGATSPPLEVPAWFKLVEP